jgi:hypothetical protein
MKRILEGAPELLANASSPEIRQERDLNQPAPTPPSPPRIHTASNQAMEIMSDWIEDGRLSESEEEKSWDEKTITAELDDEESDEEENFTKPRLFIDTNDRQLDDKAALLRSNEGILVLTINCQVDVPDPWTPLASVWEALRDNTALKKIYINSSATISGQAASTDFPLALLCDAIRNHPCLEDVFIDALLLPLSANLNHELQASHSQLKHLSLTMPESQDELDNFRVAMQKNTWLKSLRLMFEADSALDCAALSRVLGQHTAMVTCNIKLPASTDACRTLIGGVSKCGSLRKLTLENVGDEHVESISAMVRDSITLRKLILYSKSYSEASARQLESALIQNFSLKEFILNAKRNISQNETATQRTYKVAEYVTSRNNAIRRFYDPLMAGEGIYYGMQLLGEPAFRETVLSAEVGALIAKEVAMRLPPKEAIQILKAVSL